MSCASFFLFDRFDINDNFNNHSDWPTGMSMGSVPSHQSLFSSYLYSGVEKLTLHQINSVFVIVNHVCLCWAGVEQGAGMTFLLFSKSFQVLHCTVKSHEEKLVRRCAVHGLTERQWQWKLNPVTLFPTLSHKLIFVYRSFIYCEKTIDSWATQHCIVGRMCVNGVKRWRTPCDWTLLCVREAGRHAGLADRAQLKHIKPHAHVSGWHHWQIFAKHFVLCYTHVIFKLQLPAQLISWTASILQWDLGVVWIKCNPQWSWEKIYSSCRFNKSIVVYMWAHYFIGFPLVYLMSWTDLCCTVSNICQKLKIKEATSPQFCIPHSPWYYEV